MTIRTNVEGHLSQSTTWRFSWMVSETQEMKHTQRQTELGPLIISKVLDGGWTLCHMNKCHRDPPRTPQIVYIKGVEGTHT